MGFNSGFKGLKQTGCALVGLIKDWMCLSLFLVHPEVH